MFVLGFSFPINVGSILSSPFLVIFLIIVVPLLVFSVYLRFTLRSRRNGNMAAGVQNSANVQPGAPSASPTETQGTVPRDEDVVKALAQVNARIDRVEATVTKAINSGLGEVMNELKNVSQGVEDAVLAIKAAQSDAKSPFNAPIPHETDVSPAEDKKEVEDEGPHMGEHSLNRELGEYNLGRLLEACAVLEILNYNKKQVEWLFEVGLLDVEHLELIGRIEEVLEGYTSGLRARDIAEIVLKTHSPQAAFQETARRVLRVLHEMGDAGAGRSGQ
ncbi:MAG: hypothetical protein QW514_00130 [Thermoprotei archaeon]